MDVERGVTAVVRCSVWRRATWEPLQRAEVDTLVLGCTHYPLLSGLIQLAMGGERRWSPAPRSTKEVVRVLTEIDLLRLVRRAAGNSDI